MYIYIYTVRRRGRLQLYSDTENAQKRGSARKRRRGVRGKKKTRTASTYIPIRSKEMSAVGMMVYIGASGAMRSLTRSLSLSRATSSSCIRARQSEEGEEEKLRGAKFGKQRSGRTKIDGLRPPPPPPQPWRKVEVREELERAIHVYTAAGTKSKRIRGRARGHGGLMRAFFVYAASSLATRQRERERENPLFCRGCMYPWPPPAVEALCHV